MVLVVTDAFTKIVRLTAIPDKSATTVAKAIMDSWIYVFGVPKTIITDGGHEFCNLLNKAIWDSLGIQHTKTTPFHPQTNSNAEVFNKTMAHYLTTTVHQAQSSQLDWELLLGPLMLSFNTAVHKSTRNTPFYTMFGYDPRVPLWNDADITKFDQEVSHPDQARALLHLRQAQTLARQAAHNSNQHAREQYTAQYNKHNHTALPTYQPGDHVWLRFNDVNEPNRKLSVKWEPAVIENATDNPAVFKVLRLNRKRKPRITINVQQMKPRLEAPPDYAGLYKSDVPTQTYDPATHDDALAHPTRMPTPTPTADPDSAPPIDDPPPAKRPFTRAQARLQQRQMLSSVGTLLQQQLLTSQQQLQNFVNALQYDWLYQDRDTEQIIQDLIAGKGSLVRSGGGPPPPPPPPQRPPPPPEVGAARAGV